MYWLLYRLILCTTSTTFPGFFIFYQEQNVPPGSKLFLTLKQELKYSAGFFSHMEVTHLYMDVTGKLFTDSPLLDETFFPLLILLVKSSNPL